MCWRLEKKHSRSFPSSFISLFTHIPLQMFLLLSPSFHVLYRHVGLVLEMSCSGQRNRPGDPRLVEKRKEGAESMPEGQQWRAGDWEVIFLGKREFNNSYLQEVMGVLGSESRVFRFLLRGWGSESWACRPSACTKPFETRRKQRTLRPCRSQAKHQMSAYSSVKRRRMYSKDGDMSRRDYFIQA